MEKDHKELEVSVHKLTRRNKELRKENGKLRKDNYILIGENEKLQDQIKDITQEAIPTGLTFLWEQEF